MARYSSAYSDLVDRFLEIETIISMARSVSATTDRRRRIERVNILCRSGIVLLSSHIEAYIRGLGELAINRIVAKQTKKDLLSLRFRYHLSRDLIRTIGTSTDVDSEAAKIDRFVKRDMHIWDDSAVFVEPLNVRNIIGNTVTPNHSNIMRFFGMFGFYSFDGDLASILKSNHPICVNGINGLVAERNKIAHGDHLAVGTPSELKDAYCQSKLYCRATDIVVGNWFRDIGCSIR